MSENLSENVLKKIQENKIAPKAKWQFTLQMWLVRTFFVISIVLGGISFGISFYLLQADWSGYERVMPNAWRFFTSVLPYFWLMSSVLCLVAAHWNFSHSRRGYRFSLEKILALNLTLSLLLGALFFFLGLAPVAESWFMSLSPGYRNSMLSRERVWQRPAAGVLAGQIYEVSSGGTFLLVDLDHNRWQVKQDSGTWVGGRFVVQKGEWVRIFGVVEEDDTSKVFLAREIRSLGPPGRRFTPLLPRLLLPVFKTHFVLKEKCS